MGTNLDDEVVVEGGRRLQETFRRPDDQHQVVLVHGRDALQEKNFFCSASPRKLIDYSLIENRICWKVQFHILG